MKLSELNVAIRNLDHAPKVKIKFFEDDDVGIELDLVKGPLLASLKARFVGRTAETGLMLSEEGFLKRET